MSIFHFSLLIFHLFFVFRLLHWSYDELEVVVAVWHLVFFTWPCTPRVDASKSHLALSNVDGSEWTLYEVARVVLLLVLTCGEVAGEIWQ